MIKIKMEMIDFFQLDMLTQKAMQFTGEEKDKAIKEMREIILEVAKQNHKK